MTFFFYLGICSTVTIQINSCIPLFKSRTAQKKDERTPRCQHTIFNDKEMFYFDLHGAIYISRYKPPQSSKVHHC